MPTTHLEIETTFDVDPGVDLPDLTSLPGVAAVVRVPTVRLVATYYDTPDLRLLRARTTLRRRTGGGDAGWHLKLPVDRGRLEVHAPATRPVTRIPAELVSLTRTTARREPLGAIARLTTWRRVERLLDAEGEILAEVAVDDVVAEVTAGVTGAGGDGGAAVTREWHEVEVELMDGGPEVMAGVTALLRDVGARPAEVQSKIARALGSMPPLPRPRQAQDSSGPKPGRAGAIAVAYCRTQVEELFRLDPQVRLDAEDAVHQMRVAARRLRSALATFRPVLDRDRTDPLREELRWLGQALGGARDLEVLRERLLSRVEDLRGIEGDLVRGPVDERLRAELDGRRERALAEARADLDSERYLALLDALEAFVTAPPFTSDAGRKPTILRRRLVRDAERVLDRAHAADALQGRERDIALHDVRKAAKRARYAAEALTPALGTPAGRLMKQMKALQEVLGVRQDQAVARELLGEVAVTARAAGEDTFTYGVLVGLEHEEAAADENRRRELLAKVTTATAAL